ncbi:hypothetical protein [Kordia jejudonensis]|uniref:hypothetical protein n=1 Tax=Kordia jejudonensis TaxID=1348245 RepID=UPI0006298F08|nr:hypothetical protein [Kordia jejudonensis]
MKKITLSIFTFFFFCVAFAQQDLIDIPWKLHQIIIDGNVTNIEPLQGINNAKITFFESSPNNYEFLATAGDTNYAFNPGATLTFTSDTFTVDF